MLLTLPLHGIPVLGQVAWVFLNGWIYAWELENEFMVFARERRSCGQQWRFVKQRFGSFATFGATAVALELPLDAAFSCRKAPLCLVLCIFWRVLQGFEPEDSPRGPLDLLRLQWLRRGAAGAGVLQGDAPVGWQRLEAEVQPPDRRSLRRSRRP